jgi:hypothetical protein
MRNTIMESKEQATSNAGTELPVQAAEEVGGGATATVSTGCGVSVSTGAPTTCKALNKVYEGVVETNTHEIETFARSASCT